MGLLSFLNRSQYNQNLGVREFRGSTFDAQATVNQYGQHNHAAGMRENALESGMDVATMIGGPVGVIANGGNAIRHAFKGNWGSALGSAGKAVASVIPGLNLIVGGASLLKNGSDVVRHAGGALEQKMKGGYERQTQMANHLMGGNMQNGFSTLYGGNHMMMGGYYGQGTWGNYGGAGFSPGYW